MVDVFLEGKKIEVKLTTQDFVNKLELMGARRVFPLAEGKTVEKALLDPLTVGIIVYGVGQYIFYRLSNDKMVEVKEVLRKSGHLI